MSYPSVTELSGAGLTSSLEGTVLTITLDKPKRRNSQTPRMWHALAAIGGALPDGVRVVVLRGAGPCFSAGIDVAMLSPEGLPGEESLGDLLKGDEQVALDAIAGYQAGFRWLHRTDAITIAQVHGYAIGAGFQLALACDLRVLADDALLCMKEPALGLVPDLLGTKPLVDAVGYARALEICATARYVGAQEARETGLATVVVPREQLEETTGDLVAAILANNPHAVAETKALLRDAGGRDLEAQGLAERQAQARRFRALSGETG